MKGAFALSEVVALPDAAPVELAGEVVSVDGRLRAPCTDRPCVAFQANVALTTPTGPDVVVTRQAEPFHLRGVDGVVLVRAEIETIRLRHGVGGFVGESARWDEVRAVARAAGAVATNWYERILRIGTPVVVTGHVRRELDPSSATAGYRDPPRRLVVVADHVD